MKQFVPFLLFPILAFLFCGCEEEEAQLRFSIQSVSDSNNVSIRYESPDPLHCPKEYTISANSAASELVLKCTNAKSIYLTYWPNDRYHSQEGYWTATLVDDRTIKITFDEVDEDLEIAPGELAFADDFLIVQSQTKKETLRDYIKVWRFLDSREPLIY